MNRWWLTGLLLIAAGCRPAASTALAWRPVDAGPRGLFQVEMPGRPRVEPVRDLVADRPMTGFNYLVETRKGAFVASYMDVPLGNQFEFSPVKTGFAQRTGGKLLQERPLKIDIYEAIEYEFELPNAKGVVVMRLVHAGGRAYQLSVAGPAVRATDPDVQRFFRSFKMLGFAGGPLSFKE